MSPLPGSVARIAARQHGLITRRQLTDAGISSDVIKLWVRQGWLHREFRGVYRVGHRAPSMEARYLASVLACGDGSYLAGDAAAHLLWLVKGDAPDPEVISLGTRDHEGIISHRVRRISPLETTVYRGIPVTTVPRTLADLAPRLSLDDLAEACHLADVIHHTDPKLIVAAGRGRTGALKLRAICDGDHPTVLRRLEKLFLAALRTDGLPLPQTNRRKGAHYVDCRWPDYRLTVELDSYRFHRTRKAWEEDYERWRAARRRGDKFRRYTWRDVAEDPGPMLEELRWLLRERR